MSERLSDSTANKTTLQEAQCPTGRETGWIGHKLCTYDKQPWLCSIFHLQGLITCMAPTIVCAVVWTDGTDTQPDGRGLADNPVPRRACT